MADVESLERQLVGSCASWDRGVLAVYADALQARGDPRGELIAIDLEIEARGPTTALDARRRDLLHAWLGDAATHVRSHRFGLVAIDASRIDFVGRPEARYVEALQLAHHPRELAAKLHAFAAAPRPWLARLELAAYAGNPRRIGEALLGKLVAALPALDTLALTGRYFARATHPSVRRVEVCDGQAYTEARAPLAGTVELAFVRGSSVLPAELVPAVRRVDLTRAMGSIARFAVRPLVEQITHLALPHAPATDAQRLLDTMPALVEVTIPAGSDLRLVHARAHIREA